MPLDRNANKKLRIRRNWQRFRADNTGVINPNGGLEDTGSGLQINLNGTSLTVGAAGLSITDGDKGDITVSSTGTVWTIDNDAVTFAKFQNITDARLLGRSAGSSGDMHEITVGSGLTLSGGSLVATAVGLTDGDKGDITVSSTGTVWTIDNDAVTFAKMQNIATARLLGRTTASSGDIEELTLGNGLEFGSTSVNVNLDGASLEIGAGGLRHIAFRTESSDPGSPTDGDVWYNSTEKRVKSRINGATLRSSGLIGTTTAQSSDVTSASETAFDTSVTIPANYFAAVGKAVKIRGVVRFNTGPDAATSLRIRVYIGGFTGTAVKSSGLIPVSVGITNNRSSFEVIALCYSTGSSGTLATIADQKFEDTTDLTDARVQSGGGALFTRDLTTALDVVVTAQWLATGTSRAANLHMLMVEALN